MIENSLMTGNLNTDSGITVGFDNFAQEVELSGRSFSRKNLAEVSGQLKIILDEESLGEEDKSFLEDLCQDLERGDLHRFSQRIRVYDIDASVCPRAKEFLEGIFGPLDDLDLRLLQLPDFDERMLFCEESFIRELCAELQRLNIAYCGERLPHLLEEGGLHTVRSMILYLERGDFRSAIAVRMNEGDKLRNKGELSAYIYSIFGRGERLLDAWERAQEGQPGKEPNDRAADSV